MVDARRAGSRWSARTGATSIHFARAADTQYGTSRAYGGEQEGVVGLPKIPAAARRKVGLGS
jgi:hypothetical protein